MEPSNPDPGDLGGELRRLGENLRQIFTTAWASDDRQRIQRELEVGLTEMAEALKSAADDFRQSETGRQFEQEVRDLGQRIQSGELESHVRADLMQVLRTINAELDRAAQGMASRPPRRGSDAEGPP